MSRWLSLIVTVAATAAGCNNPTCGMGTKQVQNKDGTVQCVQVDSPAAAIPCDVDGGASIVGGICVSAITCGQNTTYDPATRSCVGTGTGTGIPACPASPAPGTFCVNGALLNFVDSMPSMATVTVAAYDPVTLLQGGQPIGKDTFSTGSYKLQDLPASSVPLGLLAIVVGDDPAAGNVNFVRAVVGNQGISGGNKYRVDAYVLPKSVADGWKPAFDYGPNGGYVGKFYNDPKVGPGAPLIASETHPVMGVTLTINGAPAPGAKYFGPTLATIDSALTTTGTVGVGIAPAPVTGTFPTMSGMGGGFTWEMFPGGSVAGLVFVQRFHPNM